MCMEFYGFSFFWFEALRGWPKIEVDENIKYFCFNCLLLVLPFLTLHFISTFWERFDFNYCLFTMFFLICVVLPPLCYVFKISASISSIHVFLLKDLVLVFCNYLSFPFLYLECSFLLKYSSFLTFI